MPVCARQRGLKWRIVECETGKITKNSSGAAVDGGGHSSKAAAEKQARAINASKEK